MLKKTGFVLLFALGCYRGKSPQPLPKPADAMVAGKVTFVGVPCPESSAEPTCDGPKVGYEVTVLAKDGTTVIAKATTDDAGMYTVKLPAGDYTIVTTGGIPPQPSRHDFTVAAGATATMDLRIDTGIRASRP